MNLKPPTAATSGPLAQAHAALARGEPRAALPLALEAARLTPAQVVAWELAGIAALQTGDAKLAREAFLRAQALAPDKLETLNNLAVANLRLARYAEAAAAARMALAREPRSAAAAHNLASALQALGELDEALAAAQRALENDPRQAEGWNNIGNLYKEAGRLEDALAAYARALDLRPTMSEAFSNRLAALKLDPKETPQTLLAAHREYSRRYEWPLLAHYRPGAVEADAQKRLRIGYVSPDCHGAVPAFIRPVWRAHDVTQFEIFAYFNNPQAAETDPAIAAKLTRRVLRGLSDDEAAALVRADGIDILIDIAGHTGRTRLGVFMRRPAPIQITWLDYLGTTGLETMDYRITDVIADPPGVAEAGHSEALLRLPHTQWCWEPPRDAPEVTPLPMIDTGAVTFGSFNNYPKLTDATLVLWRRLLAHLPEARMLFVGVAPGAAERRVRAALAVADDRLRFLPRLDARAYRAAFNEIDIALDPLPFSGATTTLDALWQGVPVLTLPGATSASRSTASLLTALGLEEFIAENDDAYLALAAHRAREPEALKALRASLRARLTASPMLDATGFTAALESVFRDTWLAHCTAKAAPFSRAPRAASLLQPTRWRGADLALHEAQESLRAQHWDEGIGRLQDILRTHQNWFTAQSLLAGAALGWARAHPQCVAQLWAPPPRLERPPLVSIIVCSIDPKKTAAVSASYARQFAGLAHELIIIGDARSLSEGYNRGAARAQGDILIFSHDDIELLTPDFAARLLARLEAFDGLGVCGTRRLQSAKWDAAGQPFNHGHILHASPQQAAPLLFVAGAQESVASGIVAIDGVFMAVRREVWERTPFDEQRFDGFHGYDVDFSLRASRAGFRLGVPLELNLLHHSTGRYDLAWATYARRFEDQHRAQLAAPTEVIAGSLHCKLQDLEQMRYLLAGLWHFRYGAPSGAREE